MGCPVMALRFARGFSSIGLPLRIFPLGTGGLPFSKCVYDSYASSLAPIHSSLKTVLR